MADKVKFTLDGEEVEADTGLTIWEIANGRGLKIPHLCFTPEPGYRPDGNCRACMVEIEGERVLAASCLREPSDGMVVTTNNARAENARKMVMELLVADQPTRATAPDPKSQLWAYAETQNVTDSRFARTTATPHPDGSHPAIAVNMEACIQCNLCVRACREVQVNDVIGLAGRGANAHIIFDFNDETSAARLFSGKHIIVASLISDVVPEIAVITSSGCSFLTTSNNISFGTSGIESNMKQ